jgi:hypothetical protein
MEIPSANGHCTANALARLMGALANDGWLDGEDILSPALIAEASRERIRGQDLVLPFDMSWGAGFMRNEAMHPGARATARSGTPAGAAPAPSPIPTASSGGAYVMNKQSTDLLGDKRAGRLIAAVYG